ncbi:MAG: choice-of-anchor tandem repeat GloVer-containing protein [Chthoniobacteraceae bacterium]
MKTSLHVRLGITMAQFLVAPLLRAESAGTPEIKPALVGAFSTGVPDFGNGVLVEDGNYFGLSKAGGMFDRGTLFAIDGGSGVVSVHRSFGDPSGSLRGAEPAGQLVLRFDGFFYGVTERGGRFGVGTVFRVPVGAGEGQTLVDFSGAAGAAPGFFPRVGLSEGAGGILYGTTAGVEKEDSRTNVVDFGSVFRISTATGRFETVVKFTGTRGATPGAEPDGPVLPLPDGSLVGTTRRGGRFDRGTIFRIAADGTFTSFEFTKFGGTLPGAEPSGRLFLAGDGSVYGLAEFFTGETFDRDPGGVLWKLPPGGAPVIALELRQSPDFPSSPVGGLTSVGVDAAAILFKFGVSQSKGGVFNLSLTGAPFLSRRTAFDGSNGVELPVGTPFTSGVTAAGSTLAFTTREKLFVVNMSNFVGELSVTTPDDNTAEGSRPIDPVFFGNGDLFQRTRAGGANGKGSIVKRAGVVGPLQPLAALPPNFFASQFDSQPLAIDISNNLLLVDRFGGMGGVGRVLQIDGSGIVTTRATFDTLTAIHPIYGLTPDGFGSFYGQAFQVSANGPNPPAVYRLSGSTITRIGVVGEPDEFAYGPLVQLDANHFLGVQQNSGPTKRGRIFRVGIGGNVTTFTVFGTSATGSKDPIGPLFQEASGSFIVPAYSLSSRDVGTIVRVSPTGVPTKLGSASAADFFGAHEILAPLAEDGSGRVYGVLNQRDGGENVGVLYRADTTGKVRVIYRFRIGNEFDDVGFEAGGGLSVGPDGAIYGNTSRGGPRGGGAIFKIFPDPQATATTFSAGSVLANSALFSGELTDNGYNVEVWFSYGTNAKELDNETAHFFTGGYHGAQTFMQAVTGLKGHTSYSVQFNTKVGFDPDTLVESGDVLSFMTPNGEPLAFDDTILVTSTNPGDEFIGEVLDNDIEPDGDPLTIDSFTQGAYGSVALVGNTLVYTPTDRFFSPKFGNGRDTFTYTIKDDQPSALSAMATVTVLSDGVTVGEYAGLLFDETGADGIPRDASAAPTPDQIAAGFAQFALARGRRFSARFQVGGRSFTARGRMAAASNTRVRGSGGFAGSFRPMAGGIEARISINGRTLVLRAGQAFSAQGVVKPKSDFTMRLQPADPPDPVGDPGQPAGTGFAVVRQSANSRARIVGALPDGTKFSAKTIIEPDGRAPFLVNIKRGRDGTFDGELIIDIDGGTVAPAPGTTARWTKTPQPRATRFADGFTMRLNPAGRKYTVPGRGEPPLDLMGGELVATFDRGGLFAPLTTRFTFDRTKAVVVPGSDGALAKAKFNARTGLVSGTFKPGLKAVKYRGVLVLQDNVVGGFFLGTADAGSVQMNVEP